MSLYSRLLAIRAGHRRSGPSLLFLTILPVLLFSTGCTPTQIIAASDWKNRPEIMLGVFTTGPALSPDGKSVVLPVMVRGVPGTKLVVLNVGNGELRTFDSPPDEVWEGPSFSPTGNRIAFLRHCMDKCTGRKGHHVSILDQKTGEVTIVTKETRIVRVHPVFSPDGRFVAYGSLKRIYEGTFARLEWSYWWGVFTDRIRILDLVTGVEHEIPSEKYGIEWNGPVFPKGWLNENTLLISARRPKALLPGDRKIEATGKDYELALPQPRIGLLFSLHAVIRPTVHRQIRSAEAHRARPAGNGLEQAGCRN